MDIGKPALVYDFDQEIASRSDAEAALKEYFLQQYTAFRRLNETAFDADLNTSMSAIEETPSKYYTHFKSTTFVLHEDGRLYEKKYAGP